MTRKIFNTLLLFCCLFLVSCLETEEKIVIKSDNSGDYSLTMDMSNLLKMAKEMKQGKSDENDKKPEKKDSTIYFKSFVDTSTTLSAEEKAIMRDGKLRLKIDEEEGEGMFVIQLPFKRIQDLPKLRETYMKSLKKLGVMDKLKDKKEGNEEEDSNDSDDLTTGAKTANPAQDSYTLSATPGKLTYKLTDKKVFEQMVTGDSTMKMVKNMSAMLGEMKFKTTIVLPRAAKKFKGNDPEVSADKKTLTFTSSLSELFEKPEVMEYELEY